MSVNTICQICGTAMAEHDCEQCGALVCGTHFELDRGVCSNCAAGTTVTG